MVWWIGSKKSFGSRKIRHPVERVVVDQNGAEQGLFRLDIVRCAPIGRSAHVGSELQNVRIKWGHGARVLLELGQMRGGDQAPAARQAKAPNRLMPDSHNGCGEYRGRGGLPLDGVSRGAVASFKQKREGAWTN